MEHQGVGQSHAGQGMHAGPLSTCVSTLRRFKFSNL